jgi:hypothetical protein
MKGCEVQSLEILGEQDFTTDLGNLFQNFFGAIRNGQIFFRVYLWTIDIYIYFSSRNIE